MLTLPGGPAVLGNTDFTKWVEPWSKLREAAQPVLHWLAGHGGETYAFAVASPDSCLLDITASGRHLPPGAVRGAVWSREHVGLTALGIAWDENRPAVTRGAEHEWPALHPWAVLAAPIQGGQTGLEGLLVAWGPETELETHSLAMVGAAALSVGTALRERRSANELQTVLKYQAAIVESISDGLLTLDAEGVVTYMNPAAGRILGLGHTAAVGHKIGDLVGFRPVILDVLRTGEGYTDREFIIRDSMRTFHFIKTAIPIRDDSGKITGAVDAFREIHHVRQMVNRLTGAQARFTFDDFIGNSPVVQECLSMARVAARSSSNVLILGESGTGKEILAQAVHNASPFADGPFVAVNCGAIPRDLIEGELFGAEEGAFTGAPKGGRPGKFEMASGGTIFLDEIGDMPLDMQVKLLRVLQEKRVTRLGGKYEMEVRCRVIAATNHDLPAAVRDGAFRRDLYYRLNVFSLVIPPLSQRMDDLPLLVDSLLQRLAKKLGKPIRGISQEAMDILSRHTWPGNVRELENVLERAANVAEGEILQAADVHLRVAGSIPVQVPAAARLRTIHEMAQDAVLQVVEACGGNITQAALKLGCSRNTVYAKLREARRR